MTDRSPRFATTDNLQALSRTARDTDMGKLLRTFWHPIARSALLKPGTAMPVRILSEDLTLYRGASGRAYLIGGRCAHRLTLIHTGWVEGEEIRCIYHGWRYDGAGHCTERPAENDKLPTDITIDGYALHEYGGLVFAYLGAGPAPAFDLPRKDAFERPGGLLFTRTERWQCNWFQQVENSLDATHVSFVHQAGIVGTFGQAVTAAIPELDYIETDAGIRQTATRGKNNVRVSDWTFPNSNHIIQPTHIPGDPWIDIGHWVVPNDDETTTRTVLYAVPAASPEIHRRITEYFDQYGDYNPADHHDDLFLRGKYPEDTFLQLTSAQDYVAAMGQGTIVDRTQEHLGKSDLGVALLRRICWREMAAIRNGQPTKEWRRLLHATEMPVQAPETVAG